MPDLIPGGDARPSRSPLPAPTPSPHVPAAPLHRDDETIELRDVLDVLRRNLLMVLLVAAACTGAAAYFAYTQVPQYRAEAVFRLKNEQQALAGPMGSAAMEQVMGKTADPLLSEIQVLRSRTVLTDVVDQLGLRLRSLTRGISVLALRDVHVDPAAPRDTIHLAFGENDVSVRSGAGQRTARYGEPLVLGPVRFTVPSRPSLDEASFVVLPAAQAADRILEKLIARPVDRTDVVQVQFTSADPLLAETVVNTTVEAFRKASTQQAVLQSRRRRAFIEEQLTKTDSALAAAQAELSGFRMREEVLSSREQFAAQQANRMELELRREELDAERRMYVTLLTRLERGGGDGLGAIVSSPGIAQNPMLAGLYSQLLRYRASHDSLTAGGRAQESQEVRRLASLIASTQEQLRQAASSHIASLEARIASVDGLRERSSAEIRSLPEKEGEEMRLVQRLETARRVADQLREEYQRAQIAEAVEVGQVEVVDWATAPREPVGSGRPLKVALGLMLGLMLGSGGAFLREHLDRKVSSRSELEPLLGAPVLGTVPSVQRNGAVARASVIPLRLPVRLRRAPAATPPIERPGATLITLSEAHSVGAEAFRSVRTNLLFSRAAQRMQTLVVTSSMPAEGKSTTSANLAIAFAQQGMRVVLVDADLRRSSLHALFDLSREPGLVNVLGEGMPLAEVLRPGGTRNLEVISAGPVPYNPAELLGSTRMQGVLEELKAQFDLVIMDTPPILAAGDASILSAVSDGTVIVVRMGHTDRDAARSAAEQVRAVGGRLLGSVLNDPDGKMARYGHTYYHSYYGN